MKIEDYNRKFEEEKKTERKLLSDPYMIQGFKMRLQIYLNGLGDRTGTHLSVHLQLMKGELDNFLKWPFDKIIHLVVIHQDDKNKCFKRLITDALRKNAEFKTTFQKPDTNDNTGIGYRDFISHKELHDGGFVKNDSLYIRCIIE